MTATEPLSTVALCSLAAGLTFRRRSHWTDAGHLQPIDGKAGSGRPLRWPPLECRVALDMVTLLEAGLTVPAAAHVARRSQERGTYLTELAGDVFVGYRPSAEPPDEDPCA